MQSFPIALKLAGRKCLVTGSGSEAAARARALAECGAQVTVLCSAPVAELEAEALRGGVTLERRTFREGDLAEQWLAVLTDRDAETAAVMQRDAERYRVFFCAVDQPSFNSFSHLAIARASSLFVATGTEGRVPSLSRRLRQELQRLFDESRLAEYVDRLAALRASLPTAERAARLNDAVESLRIEGGIVRKES